MRIMCRLHGSSSFSRARLTYHLLCFVKSCYASNLSLGDLSPKLNFSHSRRERKKVDGASEAYSRKIKIGEDNTKIGWKLAEISQKNMFFKMFTVRNIDPTHPPNMPLWTFFTFSQQLDRCVHLHHPVFYNSKVDFSVEKCLRYKRVRSFALTPLRFVRFWNFFTFLQQLDRCFNLHHPVFRNSNVGFGPKFAKVNFSSFFRK